MKKGLEREFKSGGTKKRVKPLNYCYLIKYIYLFIKFLYEFFLIS